MACLLNIACVDADVFERFLDKQRLALNILQSLVVFPNYHLIHAEDRIDRSPDLMGHVGKEVTLRIISALCADLLCHELALGFDIRPYRKKGKNSAYKERNEKNDDISDYRGTGLGRELVFEPVDSKVNGYDSCHISLVVENRAVRTVEFAPLVGIRNLVNRSFTFACIRESDCIFNAVAVARRAYLVQVHRENKITRGFFLNAVYVFEFYVISEYCESIVDPVIFIASYSILGQSLHYLAVDRTRSAVRDI